MDRNKTPRRRPEAPSAPPTTITELARRYHSCAVALATSLGLPMTEAFLRDHRESVSSIFIAADRAGVRLPSAVQLPPLHMAAGDNHLSTGDNGDVPDFPPPHGDAGGFPSNANQNPTNGDTPPRTMADLPTRIPAGLQLPCAEALIVDLRPAQLSLLIGKVGLRALADKRLEPLHVALLAERAGRLDRGRKTTGEG